MRPAKFHPLGNHPFLRQLAAEWGQVAGAVGAMGASTVDGGGSIGSEGLLIHSSPDTPIIAKITAKNTDSPPAYSWTLEREDQTAGDYDDDQDASVSGGPGTYPDGSSMLPAYERSGNANVPVNSTAKVQLHPAQSFSGFWFSWPAPGSPPGSILSQRLVTSVCKDDLTASVIVGSTTALSSATWTDLTGATLSFTLFAGATTVTVAGDCFVSFPLASLADNIFRGQLVLTDPLGNVTTQTGYIELGGAASSKQAGSFSWVLPNLGPGTWTVKLQGQRNAGSDTITVGTETNLWLHADTTIKVMSATVGIPGGTMTSPSCEFNPSDCTCPPVGSGSGSGGGGGPGPIVNECCPGGVPLTLYAQAATASGTTAFTLTYDAAINEWVGTWPGDASCAAAGVQVVCVGGQFYLVGPLGSIVATTQACSPGVYLVFSGIQNAIPCSGTPIIVVTGDPPISTPCCGGSVPLHLTATVTGAGSCNGVYPLTYNATGPQWATGAQPIGTCSTGGNPLANLISLVCNSGPNVFVLTVVGQPPAFTLTCVPFSIVATGVNLTACGGTAGATVTISAANSGGGGGPITSIALGTAAGGAAGSSLTLTPSITPIVGDLLVVDVLLIDQRTPESVTFGGVPMTFVADAGIASLTSVYMLPLVAGMDLTGPIVCVFLSGGFFCQLAAEVVRGLPLNAVDTTASTTWFATNVESLAVTTDTPETYIHVVFGFADVHDAAGNITLGTWQAPFFTGGQDVLGSPLGFPGPAYAMTQGYDIPGATGTFTAALTVTTANPPTDVLQWSAVGVAFK